MTLKRIESAGNGRFPAGDALRRFDGWRRRRGTLFGVLFMASTLVGIVALTALIVSIVNDSFGYVAVQNERDPQALAALAMGQDAPGSPDVTLADLDKDALVRILASGVSAGRMRALEAWQPMKERTREDVLDLVVAEVVRPTIVRSWPLLHSLLNKADIEATAAGIPDANLEWRNWISWDFVASPQSSNPAIAGVRTAIFGSLWVVAISMFFAVPLGIGAAVYLEEYSDRNWFSNLVDTNINNLAGVPSIIYGLLGLAIFVRALEPLTSGAMFGASDPTTANGRTALAAGLTLGLLTLPLIIINAREAIRAVPSSLREASYGLGATRWQTVWSHVLPNAIGGILTGSILAVSRAIGETAPLVVVGASTFITMDPSGPFSKFTVLPAQIYQWTARPQAEFRNLAAAASLTLLLMLIVMNSVAVYLRNRYSSQRM